MQTSTWNVTRMLKCNKLLEKNVIQPLPSPYSSPLWIIPKKANVDDNKRWRLVIDYRMLNEKTVKVSYPLPNITGDTTPAKKRQILQHFRSCIWISPATNKEDAPKNAFSKPYGHYEFLRMPFGLKKRSIYIPEVDELNTYRLTRKWNIRMFGWHSTILKLTHWTRYKISETLWPTTSNRTTITTDKMNLFKKRNGIFRTYHLVSSARVKPDPGKVKAVREFPVPCTNKNIKQFWGSFFPMNKPLTNLLKKRTCLSNGKTKKFFRHVGRSSMSRTIIAVFRFYKTSLRPTLQIMRSEESWAKEKWERIYRSHIHSDSCIRLNKIIRYWFWDIQIQCAH